MSTDQIGILQLQRADLAVMSGPGVACEVLGLLCDCLVEPVVEDVLGAWVAHVPAVSACDEVFLLPWVAVMMLSSIGKISPPAVDDERTCPQARCGSCGGARGTRRRSPSTGTPSGCRSWRPSAAAMAWTGTVLGLPGGQVHLEIVRAGQASYPGGGLDQLVFYLPDAAAREQMQARLAAAGARPVPQSATGRPTPVSPTRTRTAGKSCSHPGSRSRQDRDQRGGTSGAMPLGMSAHAALSWLSIG